MNEQELTRLLKLYRAADQKQEQLYNDFLSADIEQFAEAEEKLRLAESQRIGIMKAIVEGLCKDRGI